MEEQAGSWAWAFAVLAGPIIFGLAVAWLMVGNRSRRRSRRSMSPADKPGDVRNR